MEAAVVRDACERDVGEHGGVGRERKGSDYIRGERGLVRRGAGADVWFIQLAWVGRAGAGVGAGLPHERC